MPPRERGRLARILIPANSLRSRHSLTTRTEPAFTGVSSITLGLVRARLPGWRPAPPTQRSLSLSERRVGPPPARLRAPPLPRRLPLKGGVILER